MREDLCQEVFLRCYTANARFDSPSLVRPWLIGIARNLLRERVRRLKRRREVAWTELCLELETWHPPDDQRHDDAVRMLPNCLDSLGQTAREALDLHYRSSLRLAAIADRLHRSEVRSSCFCFVPDRPCGFVSTANCEPIPMTDKELIALVESAAPPRTFA